MGSDRHRKPAYTRVPGSSFDIQLVGPSKHVPRAYGDWQLHLCNSLQATELMQPRIQSLPDPRNGKSTPTPDEFKSRTCFLDMKLTLTRSQQGLKGTDQVPIRPQRNLPA